LESSLSLPPIFSLAEPVLGSGKHAKKLFWTGAGEEKVEEKGQKAARRERHHIEKKKQIARAR